MIPAPGARKDQQDEGGCSQHPPFFFLSSADFVSRTRCSVLHAALQSRDLVGARDLGPGSARLCVVSLRAAPRPGHEPLPLCTCTGQAKPPIWTDTPRSRFARSRPLESQSYSSPVEPPDAPHEPILTLPGALTAYVLLIAIDSFARAVAGGARELDHRRVRLHSQALRFDAARTSLFRAARAPRSGPSSPTPCCMPISAISASTCCGCCRSAARWRAGSVLRGFSHSWR